jgi:Putative zinc dependent peptidase (DUF5700)
MRALISAVALIILAQTALAQRVNVSIVTDEAEAVLTILNKKASGRPVTESDWQQLFNSEGYVRLKKRELAMNRPFAEEDFKAFVLSDKLGADSKALAETLAKWKTVDVQKVAALPLAYLPRSATFRAKIYPIIKPRENSFVFDIPDDPAIFFYLDPKQSKDVFENHLAHELHHIGFGTACPNAKTESKIKKLPENSQKALKWIGAFGEGFAMLAAAGGADIHPHKFSAMADQERWDKDVANFNSDLKTVEKFLLELSTGKLSEEKANETARSFYGVQGPWYTVGWQMAVVIEKIDGRKKLIEVMCDQRKLLSTYNKALPKFNSRYSSDLRSWSKDLVKKLQN